MNWIKCEDKMPKNDEEVLLYIKELTRKNTGFIIIRVGRWDSLNKLFVSSCVFDLTPCDYDHDSDLTFKKRMVKFCHPLPEPPE